MENHPFDRIDPQSDLQLTTRYCLYDGKELNVTGHDGDSIRYRCPACDRKYKSPADGEAFDNYRGDLNRLYFEVDYSNWDDNSEKNFTDKLASLQRKYTSFASNDIQYLLIEIMILSHKFKKKYHKNGYTTDRIESIYETVQDHKEDCYPVDIFAHKVLKWYMKWAVEKKVSKKLIFGGIISLAAIILISFFVTCFVSNNETVIIGDTEIIAEIDNDSYGMLKKWSKKFEVRELDEGTSEYETASILLKNESEKYKIFDMSVLSGSNVVQPKAPVRIEMTIPEDYFTRNVSVYYISPDGKYQSIECERIETGKKKVVVFYAEHFSLYAIAEHPFNIGFSIEGQEIPTQTVMWGKLADEPTVQDRKGYTFLGWFDGNEKWDFSKTVAHKDVVLEGKWQANKYTLTLDYGDGRADTAETMVYDQQYTLEQPKRVGYTFLGWYDENSVMFNSSGNWKELSDIKLTARWELEGYKIRFDANGGSVSVTDKNFTYGEKYGDLPTPTRPGFEFLGWYKEKNGNNDDVITPITTITEAASHTLYARWKAIVYTITVNGIDINNSKWNDSKGNPKYNSETLTTIYFAFGDNNKSQGFYKQEACIEKIPTDYFDQFCVDNAGKINFTFGGLYSGIEITDNGHSYASYTSNIAVLSSDGQLLSNQLSLSEESRAGVLYALIIPKQYTITLDYNTSSKPKLSVTNTNATKSVKAYYNEVPATIGQMPESTYYVPSGYSSSNGTGYFNSTGTGLRVYNISGDVTMRCQWSQRYNDYTYIYDKTTLENIGASGKYLVLCDINMNGSVWTSKDSFSGELDGDGHCIYNFTISKTGGSGSAAVAFIKKNAGTIRDLNIGKTGEAKYDSKYSVKYDIGYTESSSASSLMVGGFVGENSGTITGCQLINTFINATLADNDNNEHLYLYVGGIAAYNTGTISSCHVKNSNIDANATCPKESGDDNYAWLGGICAKNSATIKQCTVQVTTLDLDVRGDGFWKIGSDNKAYPWGALGGIVGEQINGSITSCSVTDVTRNIYASSGKYTSPTTYNESVCGLKSSGTIL